MNLDRLREVAEAAIPRPWRWSPGDTLEPPSVRGGGFMVVAEIMDGNPADAEFIATFDPPMVLALLDVAEAAENYDETDIRVKSIVRKGNANSSDVRDLGRTRRQLRYALDRLREVTA